MDDIERHAALIDAGRRVGVDGKWISPDPNHARFCIRQHGRGMACAP